jgi:hypothetical protein
MSASVIECCAAMLYAAVSEVGCSTLWHTCVPVQCTAVSTIAQVGSIDVGCLYN